MALIEKKKELYRKHTGKKYTQNVYSNLGRFNFILKNLFSKFPTMSTYFIHLIKFFNKNVAPSVLIPFDTGLLNLKKKLLLDQCYCSKFIFCCKEINVLSS